MPEQFDNIDKGLFTSLSLIFLTILSVASFLIFTLLSTNAFIKQGTADIHSYLLLEDLFFNVRSAESGQRGFIITNDTSYLVPYSDSLKNVPRDLSLIQQDTNLTGQATQIVQINKLVSQKMTEMAFVIQLMRTQGQNAAFQEVKTNMGEVLMTNLQGDISQVARNVLQKIGTQESSVATNLHRSLIITPVLVTFVLSMCIIIGIYFQRSIQKERSIEGVKNEFLSLAAHQLRTPATNVKQYLNMLLEGYFGELDEEQKVAVKIADKNNETEISIMNELLSIAKLDLNKIAIHHELTDLNRLIAYVIEDYKSMFSEKKQKVYYKKTGKKGNKILVDPVYIRTVIENLVDNASKYTPEGGRIDITLIKTALYFTISVKDSGVGIKKQDIPKLFKKFSRIPNMFSNSINGSGLGLYWAYQIVELHNGRIKVSSHDGKGSDFRVILPVPNE